MTTESSKQNDLQEKLTRLREEVARLERSLSPNSARRSAFDRDTRVACLFDAVYEQSPDPSGIIGLDGTLQHANRAACDALGIPAESIGRPLWEIAWWAHSAAEREMLRNGLHRASLGELIRFESAGRSADGIPRHLEFTIRPARDETGEPRHLIFEARDISERRQGEEENKASESRLRSVFRATPIGITFSINRVIISVNESMCELMGYREEELCGDSVRKFYFTQEEYEFVGRELFPLIPKKGRVSVETRFRRKDDTAIYVVLTASMLRAEDPSAGFVVTVQDITQRKRSEEILRESEDRFRRIMEQSPFSTQVFSPQGDLMLVNEACLKLWGVTRETLEGYNLLTDPQLESLGMKSILRKAFQGERVSTPVVEYDAGAYRDGGNRRIVKGDFYPIHDANGAVSLIILIHEDITEIRRAEEERNKLQEQLQQAMKMEAVGRLAGGIAHDFNNLLTAIAGNVELARMDIAPTTKPAQYLDEIFRAAESAATLTRRLLAFSRRQIIEPRVLNLNDLIAHLQTMLVRLIGEDVVLQILLDEKLGTVRVDPGQLEQVVLNLAVNARDAMQSGGKLLIETSNVDLDEARCARHPNIQPGRFVQIDVSDTGHGMTEEVKRRLFEPFFTTKPKGKGTGLGLATIFGAVQQAGGAIEVYSEVGVGSTFSIYLPRTDDSAVIPARSVDTAETLQGNETVLLVEDEQGVREMAMKVLTHLGYKVLCAGNGGEALAQSQKHQGRIDLLMTDVVMPGINGRELAERMQKLRPEMRVLFTSGYTEDVIVHRGVMDENVSFIGKPYSLQALSRKIREILDEGIK